MVSRWLVSRGSPSASFRSDFYIQLGRPLDALFRDSSKMDADRKHIDIRRHARCTNRFGPPQIRLRGAQRLLRRLKTLGRQDRTVIRPDDAGDHPHLGQALFLPAQPA